MHFPVVFSAGRWHVPAHFVFEAIAYALGARIYFRRRRRAAGPRLDVSQGLDVLVGCLVGALLGSRLLAWAEAPAAFAARLSEPDVWLRGKTIVGGLLGGWLGVEIAKRRAGIARATGDAVVLPLAVGIAIGRIGCFLTGLDDRTYGVPTALPWGVDFGDGVRRHPTALYEMVFLAAFAAAVPALSRRLRREGDLFLAFVAVYLAFRFLVEFLKPRFHPWLGLSAIQVACLAGLAAAAAVHASRRRAEVAPAGALSRA